MRPTPSRPRSTLVAVLLVWLLFYASFTLFTPALLDDADSVHAEVAREMLVRHDYVTLHANGIRYLEKAPLLYWSMAAFMKVFALLGRTNPRAFAAAARLPLAFTMLALALLCEAFARRMFCSVRAGLYAALIMLSSFGLFIFTRILIPDAMVCLWLTLALYAFFVSNESGQTSAAEHSHLHLVCIQPERNPFTKSTPVFFRQLYAQRWQLLFAAACALNVLTKGLIGLVFPLSIVAIHALATRSSRRTVRTLLTPGTILLFLVIAAPWHILAGIANPPAGHPAPFSFSNGHWQVSLPTNGNVRGWFWFYFMNEHLLRYLNLRVPHDYDTSPLWLFWGLCVVWLMPWSLFAFRALYLPVRNGIRTLRSRADPDAELSGQLLLCATVAFVLLFYSFSTRQEYYVLPAFPAITILTAGWLARETRALGGSPRPTEQSDTRVADVVVSLWLGIGALYAAAVAWLLPHLQTPASDTDLSALLSQNPGDYALSMGHFLDLNATALGLFRFPLVLSAASLFLSPLVAFLLRKRSNRHGANLALAAGAFGFLAAAFLGLRTFAPVLSSAQLAEVVRPQLRRTDLLVIHGEYEAGSTLGFYLQQADLHILEGRSSNLWYGSFFPDAPAIFETPQSLAAKWNGPQRIFLWQSTTDEPRTLPPLPGPAYVLAKSGGKEIVSNRAKAE